MYKSVPMLFRQTELTFFKKPFLFLCFKEMPFQEIFRNQKGVFYRMHISIKEINSLYFWFSIRFLVSSTIFEKSNVTA